MGQGHEPYGLGEGNDEKSMSRVIIEEELPMKKWLDS